MTEYNLILGDCLNKMSDIEDGSVDMILADLPYGTTACKWDVVIPFEPLWAHYKRVIKRNGAVVLFGSEPFSSFLRLSNLGWYKYDWVWDKKTATGGQNVGKRPMKAHEIVMVFSNGIATYNPQMEEFTSDEIAKMRKHDFYCPPPAIGGGWHISKGWYAGKKKYPRSVIRINGITPVSLEKQHNRHPTQKPVALLAYLIRTYTNSGETVLDNVFGSGSTGEACLREGRRFIGIEKDETYYQIGVDRMARVAAELRGEFVPKPKRKILVDSISEEINLF